MSAQWNSEFVTWDGASVQWDAAPQTAPAVELSSRTHQQIIFTYIAVTGATGYEWRLNGGAWVNLGAGISPVTVSGLAPETSYTIEVRAYNDIGAGPWGLLGVTTLPSSARPPSTPPIISLASVAHEQADIDIQLSAYLATGHEWRLYNSGGAPVGEWNAIGGAMSFAVTGLVPQTSYSVSVRGYNVDGSGPVASLAILTTAIPLFPPTTAPAVQLVSALYELATIGFITGATGSDGHEYRVGGGLWVDLLDSLGDFIISDLAPGVAHALEIRGYNTDGVGPVFVLDFTTLAYPIAHAGSTRFVLWGASVTLNGSGSSGLGLTYAWVQSGGGAVTLSGANTATPSFTAPGVDAVLDFQLTVTDANGYISTDTVRIRAVEVLPRQSGGSRWAKYTHTRNF